MNQRWIGVLVLFLACAPARGKVKWEPVGLSGGGAMYEPAISPANPRLAIVHCDMSAAYLSDDGGASWRMIHTARLRSDTRCRSAFHPTDPRTIISPSGGDELRITHDGGDHWQTLARFDAELTGPITIDPHDPARVLVGAGQSVRLSDDGGKTWSACAGPRGALTGACFGRVGNDRRPFVAVATSEGVWVRMGSTGAFAEASAGLPSKQIRSLSGGFKGATAILYCTVPGEDRAGQYRGGVYRSRDLGRTWQPADGKGLNLEVKRFDEWAPNSIAQYEQVATSDANPSIVWLSGGGTGIPPPHHLTVYRSQDAGQTWHATFFPDPRYPGCNVEKDYTVVEDGQFYQDRPRIALDPRNPDHVLQINGGSCYFTADAGKTWRCGHASRAPGSENPARWRNTGLVVTTTWHYYIDPHQPNRHYVCYTDIGFARSLDAGKTWIWWADRQRAPWRNTCYELAFDPDRAGRVFGAFSDVHDIPNGNVILNRHRAHGPGGVCVSDDFAAGWKPLGGGLPLAPATAIVLDPRSPAASRTLYAGFFGAGVYKSVDGGQSWTAKNSRLGDPNNLRVCRVQLHPDGTLFALVTAKVEGRTFLPAGVGLYRSADGGDSWSCITRGIDAWWPKDFALDPADSRTVYLTLCDANGKQCAGLYRTADGGATWTRLARLGPEHFSAALSPFHRGWIYATLCEGAPSFGLYLSKDNGRSFHPVEGLPFENAMRLTFDPADPGVIYVSTFGGSVWRGPAE